MESGYRRRGLVSSPRSVEYHLGEVADWNVKIDSSVGDLLKSLFSDVKLKQATNRNVRQILENWITFR